MTGLWLIIFIRRGRGDVIWWHVVELWWSFDREEEWYLKAAWKAKIISPLHLCPAVHGLWEEKEKKSYYFFELQGKLRTMGKRACESGAAREGFMEEVILEVTIEGWIGACQAGDRGRTHHGKKSIWITSRLRDSRQCFRPSAVESV